MTDRIEPALTAEEWASQYVVVNDRGAWISGDGAEWLGYDDTERLTWKDRIPALIALANAALPDSDPRKITRKAVAMLRELIDAADHDDAGPWGESWQSDELVAALAANRALADALSSYLPPEGP